MEIIPISTTSVRHYADNGMVQLVRMKNGDYEIGRIYRCQTCKRVGELKDFGPKVESLPIDQFNGIGAKK